MLGGMMIILKDPIHPEVGMFEYSAKAATDIQDINTSSTLPNALEFVKLSSDIKNLMKKYMDLVQKDAKEIHDYIDGLNAADS